MGTYYHCHMVNRDITIDIIRGLAVFTMAFANMSAYFLNIPLPFFLRFYGSFAAPTFALVAGAMVALTTKTKKHDLKYFLLRGALIVTMGSLIDVFIVHIYPLMTVDILYLIGISIPLAYLFMRLNNRTLQWITIIAIISLMPVLQNTFGYTNYPSEFYLTGEPTTISDNQTNVLQHWLIDGWFPIFPWLAFPFLGVMLANIRWKDNKFEKNGISVGIGILLTGIIIWYLFPGAFLTRGGYSEIFYPSTIGFVLTAIGLIVTVFSLIDFKPDIIIYKPLQLLGETPLFMYTYHLALGAYVIPLIWSQEPFPTFVLIYILLIFVMLLTGHGLRILKRNWKNSPFLVRFFIGS